MANWATRAEADTYFADRHGIGSLWSGLSDDAKDDLLTTAQAAIENHRHWKFTDDGGVALTVSQSMKDAVCEQMMFYLLDPDNERRAALMAQGVSQASLIGETFAQGGAVVIAPRAAALLRTYEDPAYNVVEF